MGTKQYDNALDLITFSRASNGTSLRKISYGSELVTNGDFGDGSTGWTVPSGWSVSSGLLTGTATNTSAINRTFTPVAGRVYEVQFDVTAYTSGNLYVTVGGNFTTPVVFNTPISVGRKSAVVVAGSTASRSVEFYGGSISASIDNVSVREVLFDQPDGTLTLFNHPDDIPRIDYNPDGTVKGLLIEEQRTNLEEYSNDFSSGGWAKNGTVTLTAGEYDGPLGVNSGTKVDAGTDLDGLYEFLPSVASGSSLAVSAWFKYVSGDTELRFALEGAAFSTGRSGVVVDISDGTISGTTGSVTPDTFDVIDYGNGWYRAFFTTTTTATGTYALVVYTENGAGVFGLSGVQIEAGAFPTSYIPTSGAPATRSADIASIPVTDFGHNQKAGTVVVTGCKIDRVSTIAGTEIAMLSKVAFSTDNATRVFYRASGATGFFNTVSASTNVDLSPTGVLSAGQDLNIAFTYSEDDFATVANGGTVLTDTSGVVAEHTVLRIGAGQQHLNGHIKSIQYYPRRLTNAQLQELTA